MPELLAAWPVKPMKLFLHFSRPIISMRRSTRRFFSSAETESPRVISAANWRAWNGVRVGTKSKKERGRYYSRYYSCTR